METRFSSLLLIALPEFCNGAVFNVMPSIHAASPDGKTRENVDIVVLNCTTKEEIVPHLKKMFQSLCELPQNPAVVHNTATVAKWLDMLNVGTYEHDVPANLLEAVCRASSMMLRKNQMIYLSSVEFH